MLVDHGATRGAHGSRLPALVGSLVGLATASANRFALKIADRNFMPLNLYCAVIGATAWTSKPHSRCPS
jgi:hypothetical protein